MGSRILNIVMSVAQSVALLLVGLEAWQAISIASLTLIAFTLMDIEDTLEEIRDGK